MQSARAPPPPPKREMNYSVSECVSEELQATGTLPPNGLREKPTLVVKQEPDTS